MQKRGTGTCSGSSGAWNGFKLGLKKLGATIEHAFDNFPRNLIPWYGNYCSPAATGSNAPNSGISGYDDSVCRPHDMEYQRSDGMPDKNKIRWKADWNFVNHAVFGFGDPNVT